MNSNGINLHCNGFLVKRTDSSWARNFTENNHGYSYQGIEGDNWPISIYDDEIEKKESEFLSNYVSENIEEEAYANNGVAVCNQIEFVNSYAQSCLKANYDISLLFCETEKSFPKCNVDLNDVGEFKFIGFDYASTIPDYYSCIFHDIPRVNELNKFLLNENGLFNTLEEICEFINIREELKSKNLASKFELGDFTIYRLWKYVGKIAIMKE